MSIKIVRAHARVVRILHFYCIHTFLAGDSGIVEEQRGDSIHVETIGK